MQTMEQDDILTKDGTIDFKNNPAVKKKTGTWKACPFILGTHLLPLCNMMLLLMLPIIFLKWLTQTCLIWIGNECCERLAYYGINTNLVNYLKFQLNQRNVVAVNNVTNWSGTCYVTPLLGAFLADAYLGRYWTIACFSIIYVLVSCKGSYFRNSSILWIPQMNLSTIS